MGILVKYHTFTIDSNERLAYAYRKETARHRKNLGPEKDIQLNLTPLTRINENVMCAPQSPHNTGEQTHKHTKGEVTRLFEFVYMKIFP